MVIMKKLIFLIFCLSAIVHMFHPVLTMADTEGTLPGKISLFLYDKGTGREDEGINEINTTVGDTIHVEVFARNFNQVPVSAVELYFSIDERYFDIVSQGKNTEKNQYLGQPKPFIQGNYFRSVGSQVPSYGNNTHGDSLSASDNGLDGWQINYSEITDPDIGFGRPVSRLRYGVLASFMLVAKAPGDSITIRMDKDQYNQRLTQYHDPDSNDSYYFRSFETIYINISDLAIDPPIPDLTMEPGKSDTTIDLDDHIASQSIPDSDFFWQATDNLYISVSIDSDTHIVTFTAPLEFRGYEDIKFNLIYNDRQIDDDIMRVTVDKRPRLLTEQLPDTIMIEEDTLEEVLNLRNIVQDDDDPFGNLTWEFSSQDSNLIISTDTSDNLLLQGIQDFFGNDILTITVRDPFNLTDSVDIPVIVTPVNDAPTLSGLPDIELSRGEEYKFDIMTFAADVDNEPLAITWSDLVNLQVSLDGTMITITGGPDFMDSENITFTVTDSSDLSASDTMNVKRVTSTKGPVWSPIPKVGFAQNGEDASIVLWDYVTDEDDPDDALTFEITNYDDIDEWHVDEDTGLLHLKDTDGQIGWDRLTVTAIDPDGNMGSTQFLAFVAPADGTPIVGGIPDTTIVAGTQGRWIDLDDFYYDIDNTDDQMTWTWGRQANADSMATIVINQFNRDVTLKSIDKAITGIDKIIFTTTDPGGKFADDICIVTVVDDVMKPSLDLPPKVGFASGNSVILDLDDYVLDPEYPKSELNWAWFNNLTSSIQLLEPDESRTRPVLFSGPDDWIGVDVVEFLVSNPMGGAAKDTIRVFSVSPDGTPFAGGLLDITIKAGECHTFDLDNYYFDIDNEDYEMSWSVTGNDSISVDIDNVTHEVHVCALSETWEGSENLTFTVTDPDNKTGSMTVAVTVTDAIAKNVFSVSIFRNPMQEDYMDMFVKSLESIGSGPRMHVYADYDETEVSLATIGPRYYYGRYLLPLSISLGSTGAANVVVDGMTSTGKAVQDTTSFAYGHIGVSGGLLSLSALKLEIPENTLSNPAFITIVENKNETGLAKQTATEIFLTGPSFDLNSAGMVLNSPVILTLAGITETKGAGIFRVTDEGAAFAGADISATGVSARTTSDGTYRLGYDLTAPFISPTDHNDGILRFALNDFGSGIDPASIRIESPGCDIDYTFDESVSILTVMPVNKADESVTFTISVADRTGNTTDKKVETTLHRPEELLVEQNHPNPFNPSTHISFIITVEQTVRVDIYDLLGRKVRTLADKRFSPGRHTFAWDACDDARRSVASGTYLYRVTSEKSTMTKKMILLR